MRPNDYDATLVRDIPRLPWRGTWAGKASTWKGLAVTLVTRCGTRDGYEAVIVPTAAGAAVFRRLATRPSRRAVLHLHDLAESFAPADLARWYNDRGFHFYVADLDPRLSLAGPGRRMPKTPATRLRQLDLACAHLRETEGIAKIILSAHGPASLTAAQWCATRRDRGQADALILTDPVFGRFAPSSLDISCPVLVISGADGQPARLGRRAAGKVSLGAHVTWLNLDQPGPAANSRPGQGGEAGRHLLSEMGRWLGAYMYGRDDQLI